MQPMELVGVQVEMPSNTPIVLLREVPEPARLLPIFVGVAEATAISLALEGISTPRPMTHDLMRNLLSELSVDLERVVVTELRKRTFHAELHLRAGSGLTVVSSRPSDAIALAVRADASIYANESVIAEAGYRSDGAPVKERSEEDVLEKFKEFIDSVSPEDFSG